MHVSTSFFSFLAVGCGCFFGGLLRYGLLLLFPPLPHRLPWATLLVNLLGCLLLGLLAGLLQRWLPNANLLRLFLTTGFCGGFTTFSTFAAEGVGFLRSGNVAMSVLYVALSVGLGLLLFWLPQRYLA